MDRIRHMDWPSRLAWGLLAWPVMISLAILLSTSADPHAANHAWMLVVVGTAEVIAAAVAIVFPIWAFVTWAEDGDPPHQSRP
jgi:hypothetical protein